LHVKHSPRARRRASSAATRSWRRRCSTVSPSTRLSWRPRARATACANALRPTPARL